MDSFETGVEKSFIRVCGIVRRALSDLISVPKAGRPREHVKNHGRASTQVLFLSKAELGSFHSLEIVTGWLAPSAGHKILVLAGTFHPKRSRLLKTGFFMQVRELKIQRKNPRHA
jgi:hypothetical protein